MTRCLVAALLALSLQACSTLDALNPFSSSGKVKMAELQSFTPGAEARVVWRESVGKGDLYVLTPAVVGSTVYAAGKNGSLIRVDDGKLTWKIDAEQQLSGGVGANSAMVVVGSPKGELLAFASADGKLLWKANATSEILSPPVVGNGIVVVRSGDNRLAAYDSGTGDRKWIYQRPTPALSLRVTASPVLDGKYVFVGFPGGKLIALSVDNGAAVWEGTVALPKGATELDRVADITSSPIISERLICAVAFQGRVACFDLGNGNLLWAREMSSSVGLSSDSRYVYVTDDKGAVHALDRASGASIWKQDKLFLRRVSAPLAYGKMVAVADIQGVLHFLSRDDGSFVARMTTDGSPVVAPLQTLGGNVLVQTSKGSVYAIEAQ
jgi:outer membrane protein assembly factor BamB